MRIQTTSARCAAESGTVHRPLSILIPFTGHELARAALKEAVALAGDLGAIVTIAAVHVVPYQLPLNRPDVDKGYLTRGLESLAESCEFPAHVLLVLARDRQSAFRKLASPRSLVVIATRKRWWRTAEEALARALRCDGCRVALLTLDGRGSTEHSRV